MATIKINAQSVGDVLRATRGAAGLTTRSIGAAIGVSHGTVSKWERGESEPSVSQFVKWCHATGQRPDELIASLPTDQRRENGPPAQ